MQKKHIIFTRCVKKQDNTNKAKLGQYFHHPLHHLDPQYREVPKTGVPQRVKNFENFLLFVGLDQELPQSHLQYTDNPLHDAVMNQSTVKCPKNSVPQKHKTLKGHIVVLAQGSPQSHLQYLL